MATPEENKEIITRYVAATNRGDLDVLDELVFEDYVEHDPVPGQRPGREGLKEAYRMFNTPFPDLEFLFEDVLGEEDLVVGRGVISGTHKDTFFGIPATGKKVKWTGTRLFRLRDGKVVEGWVNIDMMGLMQQMGVVPNPQNYDPWAPRPTPPQVVLTGGDTPQRNRAMFQRMIEKVWREGDFSVADELYHPQATSPNAPYLPVGPEGVKTLVRMFQSALTDYWIEIEYLVADGYLVAARLNQGGVHTGELMGIPATGKTVKFTALGILHIANGQVIQSWMDADMLGLFQQLTAPA